MGSQFPLYSDLTVWTWIWSQVGSKVGLQVPQLLAEGCMWLWTCLIAWETRGRKRCTVGQSRYPEPTRNRTQQPSVARDTKAARTKEVLKRLAGIVGFCSQAGSALLCEHHYLLHTSQKLPTVYQRNSRTIKLTFCTIQLKDISLFARNHPTLLPLLCEFACSGSFPQTRS